MVSEMTEPVSSEVNKYQWCYTRAMAAETLYEEILEAGEHTEEDTILLNLDGMVKLRSALRVFIDAMNEVKLQEVEKNRGAGAKPFTI